MAARTTTNEGVTVDLTMNRETKNTYRFDASEDDAAIPSLYVRKSAFPNGAPEKVTITVK